jgi:hypothetical protein
MNSTAKGRPLLSLILIISMWFGFRLYQTGESSQLTLSANSPYIPRPKQVQHHASFAPSSFGSAFRTVRSQKHFQTSVPRPFYELRIPHLAVQGKKIRKFSQPEAILTMVHDHQMDALQPASNPPTALTTRDANPRREWLSISTWAIWRPGSVAARTGLNGQLGGSQIGARARLQLSDKPITPITYVRISMPTDNKKGKEGALGVGLMSRRIIPVELGIERRVKLSEGGRNVWVLSVVTGFDSKPVGRHMAVRGYGQVGVIGFRKRDFAADGEVALEREFEFGKRSSVMAGIGFWGSTQPKLARIDVGPTVTVFPKLGAQRFRLSLQWRERLAGNALPGSGPAISVGADF